MEREEIKARVRELLAEARTCFESALKLLESGMLDEAESMTLRGSGVFDEAMSLSKSIMYSLARDSSKELPSWIAECGRLEAPVIKAIQRVMAKGADLALIGLDTAKEIIQ